MARAKNIARAEARRRHRVSQSTRFVDDETLDEADLDAAVTDAPPARRGFRLPDIRADINALPQMFRERRLLWIPFILLFVAFAVFAGRVAGFLPADLDSLRSILVALVLTPGALIIPFIGGFLAPRGAYLVGFLLGLLQGILVSLLIIQSSNVPLADSGLTPITDLTPALINTFVQSILFSVIGAAFASWYRNFLKSSQERSRVSRMVREQEAVRKQKEADREARRSSSRPARP